MPSFLLIFYSIYDYYTLAGGFNSTRIVENVRDGLIQDGQQIHVFMISTTHGDTLYHKLTLSLKLKKDLVFGASHRIYILKLSICAFTIHLWRYICICIYLGHFCILYLSNSTIFSLSWPIKDRLIKVWLFYYKLTTNTTKKSVTTFVNNMSLI